MPNDYFSTVFPNNKTIAKYVYLSQTIHLEKYDRQKFDLSISAHKKVLMHELTHYLDHITTLWGANNIVKIFNALNARLIEDGQQLYHIVRLANEQKRLTLKSYYKTISKDASQYSEKWNMQHSVGASFDKNGILNELNPIIFIRFNDDSGNLLSRVPLTIESLFESRAMACEFLVDIDENKKSNNSDEAYVAKAILEKDCLEWLYDINLSEYTVAAHFVAVEYGTSDILDTFFQTFLFATLALDVPNCYFKQIKCDEEIAFFMHGRDNAFISNCDRSFLFYVLVKNAAKAGVRITRENINDVLLCSNLPPWEDMLHTIQRELIDIYQKHVVGPFSEMYLAKYNQSNNWFKNFTFSPYPLEVIENISSLPVIFGDDCDTTCCKWYDNILECQGLLNEFIDACLD